MPRPAQATEEAIIRAAEEMRAEGLSPEQITLNAVRERLGGVGSFGTINPVLRNWKEDLARKGGAAPEIPEPVRMALERAGTAVWLAAQSFSEEKIMRAEKTAAERVALAEGDRQELMAEVSRLEHELETKDKALREKEEASLSLQQRFLDLQLEHAASQERVRQMEIRLEEVHRKEDELSKLREMLVSALGSLGNDTKPKS